jgi:diadenosine tetraphosphate (Ap4A) HIT family hydrolase
MKDCPFCNPEPDRIVLESESILGLWDSFPVSPGHALLVPRRHVDNWSAASSQERVELCTAIIDLKRVIERNYQPHGYNIGINSGEVAGQTIPHLHVHVIPRYQGDVDDPRGGVRWVIPARANYWSEKE